MGVLYLAVFVILLVLAGLFYRWIGAHALQRWDQMPELIECPVCRKSGTMKWSRRLGKLVPVPRHKIFSTGNSKDCKRCLGRGFIADPAWAPSSSQSLVDGPPMPANQADDGENYLED